MQLVAFEAVLGLSRPVLLQLPDAAVIKRATEGLVWHEHGA